MSPRFAANISQNSKQVRQVCSEHPECSSDLDERCQMSLATTPDGYWADARHSKPSSSSMTSEKYKTANHSKETCPARYFFPSAHHLSSRSKQPHSIETSTDLPQIKAPNHKASITTQTTNPSQLGVCECMCENEPGKIGYQTRSGELGEAS